MTVTDQRFVAGADVSLSWTSLDAEGEPANPTGAVTAAVVRASTGDPVTVTASVSTTDEVSTLAVTAAQLGTDLDRFRVDWSDGGTYRASTLVELVGGVYFTTVDVYSRFPHEITESDFGKPTVKAARAAVENEFEGIAQRAFVPRYAEERVRGSGRGSVLLGNRNLRSVRAVYLVAADGTETAFTASELAACRVTDHGDLERRGGLFTADAEYRVCYTFGLDSPPEDVRLAALDRCRYQLGRPKAQQMTKAQTFTSNDFGTFRLATADRFKTGNDDIDAVLSRYRARRVVVG